VPESDTLGGLGAEHTREVVHVADRHGM
jgi:hypothetical protein